MRRRLFSFFDDFSQSLNARVDLSTVSQWTQNGVNEWDTIGTGINGITWPGALGVVTAGNRLTNKFVAFGLNYSRQFAVEFVAKANTYTSGNAAINWTIGTASTHVFSCSFPFASPPSTISVTMETGNPTTGANPFAIVAGAWNTIKTIVNQANNTAEMFVNGVSVASWNNIVNNTSGDRFDLSFGSSGAGNRPIDTLQIQSIRVWNL